MRTGRSRLRIRVDPRLSSLQPGSGHGNVWRHVLAELARAEGVKLVSRSRADVHLADGHEPPSEGRPLVVQVHEASWLDPALREFLDPRFASGIEQNTWRAVSAADHVITPSRAAADQVLSAFDLPPSRVHPVPHGVDHALFRPALAGGAAMVGGPYVLCVAILHPRKNLTAVRGAVSALAREGFPHALAIVGNPPADTRAEQLAREATAELPGLPGRVVHLRGLPSVRLAAVMAGADVFCLPSFYEGFGLPVLEAMACGVPVVVSDRGALPEVVGDAGLVVAPETAAVTDAVRRVLADRALAERLRRASVRRAADFSWKRTADGWLAVLRLAAESR